MPAFHICCYFVFLASKLTHSSSDLLSFLPLSTLSLLFQWQGYIGIFWFFPSVCSKQIKIYLNSGTWHWGWITQSSGSAQQQKQICRQTFVDRSLFKTLYFIKMECFYHTKSIQCRNNIDAGMHTCMHHLDSAVFPGDLLWLCCDFWFSKI